MIAALYLGFASLVAKSPAYNLTWRAKVGAQASYYVHAKSSSEGRSILIDANLTGKVTGLASGEIRTLSLSTTKASAKTAVETDPIDDVSNVPFDLQNPANDLRRFGMLANIPAFVFIPIAKKPMEIGQKWSRELGGTWKVEGISKIKSLSVIKVSLAADHARLDSMAGTYWISTADGSVVREQIHTQRDPGVDTDLQAIEWDIFVDRLDLETKK